VPTLFVYREFIMRKAIIAIAAFVGRILLILALFAVCISLWILYSHSPANSCNGVHCFPHFTTLVTWSLALFWTLGTIVGSIAIWPRGRRWLERQ
jgi:hypothetical protein